MCYLKATFIAVASVTRKNRQIFIKVAQNDFTRKMIDFDTLDISVGDLSKIIVAIGFKKSPKVQKIAKSGHTGISPGLIPSKRKY